jgi:hypothetical protein
VQALGVQSCSLTADHEIAQGRWVNAWFASHERARSTGSYLEDLARRRPWPTAWCPIATCGTCFIQCNPRLKATLEARS